MLLSLCDGQVKGIFLVRDVLILDPVNNSELTVELYEEMLEFERQLHGVDDTNTLGKFNERLIV